MGTVLEFAKTRGLAVMSISAVRLRVGAAILGGVAVLGLAGCAQPVTGTGTPAAAQKPATTSQATSTVVVTPSTVTVTPPPTVTVQKAPPKPRTPCQQLYAQGYSYAAAYTEWANAGYPVNWDADKDGLPCEQSYGEQN
jgi:hypothetical protein